MSKQREALQMALALIQKGATASIDEAFAALRENNSKGTS